MAGVETPDVTTHEYVSSPLLQTLLQYNHQIRPTEIVSGCTYGEHDLDIIKIGPVTHISRIACKRKVDSQSGKRYFTLAAAGTGGSNHYRRLPNPSVLDPRRVPTKVL